MTYFPLEGTKIQWIIISCCFMLAVLQAYALQSFGIGWKMALIDSGLSNLLLIGACLLISNNLRYYRPAKERFMYVLVWCLLWALIWLLLSFRILVAVLPENVEVVLRQTLPLRFGIGFLMLGWMAMFSFLWFNREEQEEQDRRRYDAEKLARDAELYKLRQQLQPHFLFNSLNSINALIGSRPEEARKMVLKLSDFLRGTLKKEDEHWVSLTDELQHLQLYLDIEKVRFGHRLSTEVQSEEECDACQLPPMLLQPIVENAIKFGLYDTIDDVVITIQAQKQDQLLVITVQNPFDAQTAKPRQGTGFGLSGVQRRLYLLYARTDLVEIRPEGERFTTIIKIPQRS